MRRSGVAALAVLACATPARAAVIADDPLEDTSTEAGVVARIFSFILAGPVLEPPFSPEDASPTTLGVSDLRGYFSTKTPSFKLVVHDQLTTVARSHGLGGIALGRGAAPPRWLPLTVTIADNPTTTLFNTVEWLSVAYTRGPVTVTAGRQPVSFGRAQPVEPHGPDRALRAHRGRHRVPARRRRPARRLLGGRPAQRHRRRPSPASSRKTTISRRRSPAPPCSAASPTGSITASSARSPAASAAISSPGSTAPGTPAGSSSTRKPPPPSSPRAASPPPAAGRVLPKAALGATFHPTGTLTIGPELLYAGAGAWNAADYLLVAGSPRVAIGEQLTLGRVYAAAVADWQPHPLVHAVAATIANLQDPSALASLAIVYSVASNATAQLGSYVPLGQPPGRRDPHRPPQRVRPLPGVRVPRAQGGSLDGSLPLAPLPPGTSPDLAGDDHLQPRDPRSPGRAGRESGGNGLPAPARAFGAHGRGGSPPTFQPAARTVW